MSAVERRVASEEAVPSGGVSPTTGRVSINVICTEAAGAMRCKLLFSASVFAALCLD